MVISHIKYRLKKCYIEWVNAFVMLKYYPSRKGWLLWGIVLLLVYLSVSSVYRTIVAGHAAAITVTVAVWLPILLLILTIFFGTGYLIKDDRLQVRIGPVTVANVAISEIWLAERSRSLQSAPANSLRRLRLKYKQGEVVISPEREAEFLDTLHRINPNIRLELGDR